MRSPGSALRRLRITLHAPEWRGTRGPEVPGADCANVLCCFLLNQLRSTVTPSRASSIHLSEQFHNSRALSGVLQGGFFLVKKPLGGCGPWVKQLWNSCNIAGNFF